MEMIDTYLAKYLTPLKENGCLAVCYALLAEALFIGYLGFITLFTIETLLPTFVTARFSLTQFFLILFLLSFVLIALGQYLDISFDRQMSKINKKSPALWLGLLWTLGILAISLYKFPPLTIPIIITGFFFVGFFFWKIFFSEE
ncbi:MAG: hypothetical protein AAB547_01605 [Patescibacteria group bacterium]